MKCQFCQEDFVPKTKKARFCSPKCRVYYNRNTEAPIQPKEQKIPSHQEERGPKPKYDLFHYLEEYEKVYLSKAAPSFLDQKKWETERQKKLQKLKDAINSFDKMY